MMCYKDITFCRGEGCQAFDGCFRALTQDVFDAADKEGLYISSVADPENMNCYVAPKDETTSLIKSTD